MILLLCFLKVNMRTSCDMQRKHLKSKSFKGDVKSLEGNLMRCFSPVILPRIFHFLIILEQVGFIVFGVAMSSDFGVLKQMAKNVCFPP